MSSEKAATTATSSSRSLSASGRAKKKKSSSWLQVGATAVAALGGSRISPQKEASNSSSSTVVGVRQWILDQQTSPKSENDDEDGSARTMSTTTSTLITNETSSEFDDALTGMEKLATTAPRPIPFFDNSGRRLGPEERLAIATRRGVCLDCGAKTHAISGSRRSPIDSGDVHKGVCIQCNQANVPPSILAGWKARNRGVTQKKIHFALKRRSSSRVMDTSIHSQETPKHRSWPAENTSKVESRRKEGASPRRKLQRHSSDGNVGGRNSQKLTKMMQYLSACDYESFFAAFHAIPSSESFDIVTCMKSFRSQFGKTRATSPRRATLPPGEKWVPAILSKTKASDEDVVAQCMLTLLTLATISEKYRRVMVKRGAMKAAYYVLNSVQQAFERAREVAMSFMNYIKAQEVRYIPSEATIRQFEVIATSPLVTSTTRENALQAMYHTARQLDEKSPRQALIKKLLKRDDVPSSIMDTITGPQVHPSTVQAGLDLLWRFSFSGEDTRSYQNAQFLLMAVLSLLAKEDQTFGVSEACCGILANILMACSLSQVNSKTVYSAITDALLRPEFLVDGSLALAGAHLLRNLMAVSSQASKILGTERRCLQLVIDWVTHFPLKLELFEICGEILARADPEAVLKTGGLECLIQAWQAIDLMEASSAQDVRCAFTFAFSSLSRLTKAAERLSQSSLLGELAALANDRSGGVSSSACLVVRNVLIAAVKSPCDCNTIFPGVPDTALDPIIVEAGAERVYRIMDSFKDSEKVQLEGLRSLREAYCEIWRNAHDQITSECSANEISERHCDLSIKQLRGLMRANKENSEMQHLAHEVMYNLLVPFCDQELSPQRSFRLGAMLNPSWYDVLDCFNNPTTSQPLHAASRLLWVLSRLGDIKFLKLVIPDVLMGLAQATSRFLIDQELSFMLSEMIILSNTRLGGIDESIHCNGLVSVLLSALVSGKSFHGARALLLWDGAKLSKLLYDTPLEVVLGVCQATQSCSDPDSVTNTLEVLSFMAQTIPVAILFGARDIAIETVESALNRFIENEAVVSAALHFAWECYSRDGSAIEKVFPSRILRIERVVKATGYHLGSRQIQRTGNLLIAAILKEGTNEIGWQGEALGVVLNCLLAHVDDEEIQLAGHTALKRLAVPDVKVQTCRDAVFFSIACHYNRAQIISESLRSLTLILMVSRHNIGLDLNDLELSYIFGAMRRFPIHGAVQVAACDLLRHCASTSVTLERLNSKRREYLPLLVRAADSFQSHCLDCVRAIVTALSRAHTGFDEESTFLSSLTGGSPAEIGSSSKEPRTPLRTKAHDGSSGISSVYAKGKNGNKSKGSKREKKRGSREKKNRKEKNKSSERDDKAESSDESDREDDAKQPARPPSDRSSSRQKSAWIVKSIAFLQSSPLVQLDESGKLCGLDRLNTIEERRAIKQAFQDVNVQAELVFDIATYDRLGAILARRDIEVLHISSHGDPNHLIFEDGWGGPHGLTADQMRGWVSIGQGTRERTGLKLVFISACHSEKIGEALVEAGVPHVVCCELSEKIRVDTTLAFQKSFYRAFAGGDSVDTAFERARTEIRSSHLLHARELDDEMKKFRLFSDSSNSLRTKLTMTRKTPTPRDYEDADKRIPAPIDFFGRQTDAYKIVRGIRDSRLVLVFGEEKIGKKSLVRFACHFVDERRHIQGIDKILWFPTIVEDSSELELYVSLKAMFEVTDENASTVHMNKAITLLHGRRLVLVLEAKRLPNIKEFVRLLLQNNETVKIILVGSREDVTMGEANPFTETKVEVGPLDIQSNISFFFYLRWAMKEQQTHGDVVQREILAKKVLETYRSNRLWRKDIDKLIGGGHPQKIRSAATQMSTDDLARLRMIGDKDPCTLTFGTLAELVQKELILLDSLKSAVRDRQWDFASKLQTVCDDIARLKEDYPDMATLRRREREYQEEKERVVRLGLFERAMEITESLELVQQTISAEQCATDRMVQDFEEEPLYSIAQLDELIREYSSNNRNAFERFDIAEATECTAKIRKYEEKKWYMKTKPNT
jgi:hypothetical protein